MRAVRIHSTTDSTTGNTTRKFVYETSVPKPSLSPGEVLIRVHATTIIRDELKWPSDRDLPIPGHDVSGVVAEVNGLGTVPCTFKPGDAVYARTHPSRDGTFAEYTVTTPTELALKPANIDFIQAASMPTSVLTAYQALFVHGGMTPAHNSNPGTKVLVTGAAGGVGVFAVQLAKWAGAHVIGTASSAGSKQFLEDIGTDEVVDYKACRFEEEVKDADVVLDTVGGETLRRAWACVKGTAGEDGGVLVAVATDSGPWSPNSLEGDVENKKKFPWVKPLFFIVEPSGEQLGIIGRIVDEGGMKAPVQKVMELREAAEAYELAESAKGRGKIILTVGDDL